MMCEWFWNLFRGAKQAKGKRSDPPPTPEAKGPKKTELINFHERRTVTLMIGTWGDSDRAVYAYIDYPPQKIDELVEENPNWLQEETAKYQTIYTPGAIVIRSSKPRTYQSSAPSTIKEET